MCMPLPYESLDPSLLEVKVIVVKYGRRDCAAAVTWQLGRNLSRHVNTL